MLSPTGSWPTRMEKDSRYKRLNDLKEKLLEDLERGSEASEVVDLEQSKVGRLSRMDAVQQQAMQQAGRALIRKRLTQIEKAFEALNDGVYGHCQECGDAIPEQRLDIRPEALICVSCQERLENS